MNYIYFKFLPVFEKKNIWWNLLLCPPPADSLQLLSHYPIPPIIHSSFGITGEAFQHVSTVLPPSSMQRADSRRSCTSVCRASLPFSHASPPTQGLHLLHLGSNFPSLQFRVEGMGGGDSGEQLGPITSHCRSWGDMVDRVMHRACPS